MRISSQIAWEFDRESIKRGHQIFQAKPIEVVTGPGGAVMSMVGGHAVVLRLKGNGLEAGCNCQEFYQHQQCAHVWAALLAAEEEALLSAITGSRIYLVKS